MKAYVSVELINACVKQRSIKSEEEIVEIEKAIDTTYNMHTTMMKMAAKEGPYEYEIELVTDIKNPTMQETIENLLTTNKIPYDIGDEVWDEEEKIYHNFYEI